MVLTNIDMEAVVDKVTPNEDQLEEPMDINMVVLYDSMASELADNKEHGEEEQDSVEIIMTSSP